MIQPTSRQRLLAAAVAGVLSLGVVTQAAAQSTHERAEQRRLARAQKSEAAQPAQVVAQFPQTTRTAPDLKASAKVAPKLKKMMELYDADKGAEARTVADEIIANSTANAYEHAFAAQIAAQIAYDADDSVTAMAYLQQVLNFDGLDNNAHFGAMLMLGQLQLQEEQYAPALATLDRFLTESKSDKPEHLVLKGNTLYRLDRHADAATILKQAIDASPEPRADWQQLLMATYLETGKGTEAAKLAEDIAGANAGDKRAQMNLVAVYLQGDMYDKAAAVLEKLRSAGQLTEDNDYRQLYSSYLNMDGREKQAAGVIQEGIDKGVLKPDFQAYLALAQSYYFSDQAGPAIDAYQKAAPLAPDGEAYLNLARVLWQEDRIPEAKQAARQAMAKGVKKPDDAKKIIALPGK